jgi:acetylornithine/succinyldiaminopimelate/putrescine aminotransferase
VTVVDAKRDSIEKSLRYVNPHRVKTFESLGVDLVIGRRSGYRIWDLDDRPFYDLHLNGGTFNLGHRHPEIVAALVEAAQDLDVGNHHFPSPARADLAERLAELTPGDLRYTVFASGGSEANDIAIKTARKVTGRRKVVALAHGYYGRTGLSGAAGDDEAAKYFLSDAPNEFVKVPFDDLEAMEAVLSPGDVACVLMETIPATSGFPTSSKGYLSGARMLCDQYGALYVADEVQTGLGRTGYLWGVERFGVEPDILVTGKGLSGGLYPISAAVLSARVAGWLAENGWGHVSTFGGAEIGCRVALKALEITTRPETVENARRVAEQLGSGLRRLQAEHDYLLEVRQCGLVIGLRLDHQEGALHMMKALFDEGVWAIFAGFDTSVLQFKPGLLLTEPECAEILDRVEKALGKVVRRRLELPILEATA